MPKLDLSYHSQRNNVYFPAGTCNLTCAASLIKYEYRKANRDREWLKFYPKFYRSQLEDELYKVALAYGINRESPHGISQIINMYGVKSKFKEFGTVEDVKSSIDNGHPVITHGYFTTSGHIILITGYDDNKGSWIVHDPWGEWTSYGYLTRNCGENLYYSYGMMADLCVESDGSWWIHLTSGV